ncbi:MAG: PEP-CTERM sorting domain-containing protein [Arthrospira sp. PLM2.Bin9]|nr:PEP-CTERM sorting domain-containing protein [Arthrospira sp. PLM2.Bin9]TVU53415.1 MAG: PEP-CTERM sorting domain-containing protein [Arthrospira sp. PLM2.Bin9]
MLKTKLISTFITVTAATISIVGIAGEAIASPLYLTPGETGTVRGSYGVSSSGEYEALVNWRFEDQFNDSLLTFGLLEFAEDSLFEESSDGTQYTITNDAISSLNVFMPNSHVTYRPMSARNTPGGETTAGLVDWSSGEFIYMSLGVRAVDIGTMFERLLFMESRFSGGRSIEDFDKMFQEVDELFLGMVTTRFTVDGHTSYGSREVYLDLSNYNPTTANNPQSVPEPASAIALVALAIAGLTSLKKNRRSV